MPDSIPHTPIITDSTVILAVKPDSLPKESISIPQGPKGEIGIDRHDEFRNESWVFAVSLFLFLFMIYSTRKSYGWIKESISNFTKVKTRQSLFSDTTQSEYNSRHLVNIFSTGVISLYCYVLLKPEYSEVSFLTFILLFGASLAFLSIKILVFNFLAYVFFDNKLLTLAKEHYFLLFGFLGISIFPILLIRIFSSGIQFEILEYISGFFALLFPIVFTVKLIQIFSAKFVEIFYILLYLCTLEIIPLTLMIQVYDFIIRR